MFEHRIRLTRKSPTREVTLSSKDVMRPVEFDANELVMQMSSRADESDVVYIKTREGSDGGRGWVAVSFTGLVEALSLLVGLDEEAG